MLCRRLQFGSAFTSAALLCCRNIAVRHDSVRSVPTRRHRRLTPAARAFEVPPNHATRGRSSLEHCQTIARVPCLSLSKERHISRTNSAVTFCSHWPCPAPLRLSQEIAG